MERCQKAHRLPRAASAVVAGGVRNAGRLLLLARLLARHRALFVFKRFAFGRSLMWAARRLAPVLQEAGPSLVRIGQALANRSALPGEDLDRDLAGFQHRSASPSSFVQVRAAIEEEFGKPLEALFHSFDERPVATTPIAQVYFAVDTQGREVAVKVLRPGIERFFARHLGLLFSIGRYAEANLPALRRLRLVASLQSLAEMVAVEMDLSLGGGGG